MTVILPDTSDKANGNIKVKNYIHADHIDTSVKANGNIKDKEYIDADLIDMTVMEMDGQIWEEMVLAAGTGWMVTADLMLT